MAEDLPVTLPVTTLSGEQINLPDDLPDMVQLFIIGFSRSSRQQTRAWAQSLHGIYGAISGIKIHQVAALNTPRFIRGFIIDRIRDSIPKHRHDTFMLATKKMDAWKNLVGFKENDAAYLVLMNRKHEIVWKHTGALSHQSLRALENQISLVLIDR